MAAPDVDSDSGMCMVGFAGFASRCMERKVKERLEHEQRRQQAFWDRLAEKERQRTLQRKKKKKRKKRKFLGFFFLSYAPLVVALVVDFGSGFCMAGFVGFVSRCIPCACRQAHMLGITAGTTRRTALSDTVLDSSGRLLLENVSYSAQCLVRQWIQYFASVYRAFLKRLTHRPRSSLLGSGMHSGNSSVASTSLESMSSARSPETTVNNDVSRKE